MVIKPKNLVHQSAHGSVMEVRMLECIHNRLVGVEHYDLHRTDIEGHDVSVLIGPFGE